MTHGVNIPTIGALALLALLASGGAAKACLMRFFPQADRPELYSDIFIAEVRAVEIVGPALAIGFPPYHRLTVDISKTIKGDKQGQVVLERVTGCGLPLPRVGQWTTFYLSGKAVLPDIYRPQPANRFPIFQTPPPEGPPPAKPDRHHSTAG
tara:strand:+ start:1570 stop:2025 length:456 start_codon:yes stop_codon:yes gene_type:complete